MRIRHKESNFVYEITETKDNYRLVDSQTGRAYLFKESYDAIWQAIELIRNVSIDLLREDELDGIRKRAHLVIDVIPKSLLFQIRKEKITRTYYDQVFLKLLSNYRLGTDEMILSNQTNFTVEYEIAFFVRQTVGATLTIPSITA